MIKSTSKLDISIINIRIQKILKPSNGLSEIYITLYLITSECALKTTWEITNLDHILGHKTYLNIFQKIKFCRARRQIKMGYASSFMPLYCITLERKQQLGLTLEHPFLESFWVQGWIQVSRIQEQGKMFLQKLTMI